MAVKQALSTSRGNVRPTTHFKVILAPPIEVGALTEGKIYGT